VRQPRALARLNREFAGTHATTIHRGLQDLYYGSQIPKRHNQTGASGGPRSGMVRSYDWPPVVGSPGEQLSRHIGAGSVAGWGSGSRSFSRWVLHLDPDPQPTPKQARRRDGIPAPCHCPATSQHPYTTAASAWRAPRVPLLTATSGKQRSLQSYAHPYPQVSIRAGQSHDRCPI